MPDAPVIAPSGLEATSCLLCGSINAQPFLTLTDMLLGLGGTFSLVRCRQCRLVYQNPRPAESAIGAYYPPEYDPFVAPPWTEWRIIPRLVQLHGPRKRWRLIERWAARRDGPRRILDVGCATGIFLAAGSHEWQKVGVELTEDAAAFARKAFGLTIHQGTLEAAPLTAGEFDVVTMWDVVEHLHHPRRTLERIGELLRPDGIFVFRVPNLDAWDARLFGRYWAGLDQPRHLFVPDEQTISRLLSATGFVEVDRQCLSGTYGVLVLSWRFWVQRHVQDARSRRRLERLIDNFATRLLLSPTLWIVDKVAKKGPLLTVVARPARA